MDNIFDSLIGKFVEESLPMAERLVDAFLEIERRWAHGDRADDALTQVRGDLHTLKGNSGMMGLSPIQALAHSLEDVCVLLVEQPGLRNAESADHLIQGGDLLLDMVRRTRTGQLDPKSAERMQSTLDRWMVEAKATNRGSPVGEAGTSQRATVTNPAEPARGGKGPGSTGDMVRIDFRRLDALLEMVGEALITHSMLQEAQRRLWPRSMAGTAHDDLDRAMQSLDKTLKGLQECVMETRLLPIATVFRRFTKPIRDVAREHGKRVCLVTSGDETPIDKTVIDRLGDPLLHLIRNAIAHGIESPAERVSAGKPEEAIIRLEAEQLSDRVVISVVDDGRGLDEQRILVRARKLGYETAGLCQTDLQSLIFLSGFSTADSVTELSGRGIGLDVVAATIQSLGGNITVRSEPGRGAAFLLNLPLTLAIVKTLIVEVDAETYALPLSYVMENVSVGGATTHSIARQDVMTWRGEIVHLVDGGVLLGSSRTGVGKRTHIIVIAAGGRRCGLLVDRVMGHREMVVKGLEEVLGQHKVISGMSIMGDGRVTFILDAARIAEGKAVDLMPLARVDASIETQRST